jgi:hypothetical protein
MFYRWQKEFFENAAAAFEPRSRRVSDGTDRRIALLLGDWEKAAIIAFHDLYPLERQEGAVVQNPESRVYSRQNAF